MKKQTLSCSVVKSRFMKALCMNLLLFAGCSVSTASEIPHPSRSEAITPQKIVHYFCDNWKKGNYLEMYGSITPAEQGQISFEDFKREQLNSRKTMGVPEDCKVEDILQDMGSKLLISIQVNYINNRVGSLTVQSWIEKNGTSWRIGQGGLIGGSSSNPFF